MTLPSARFDAYGDALTFDDDDHSNDFHPVAPSDLSSLLGSGA